MCANAQFEFVEKMAQVLNAGSELKLKNGTQRLQYNVSVISMHFHSPGICNEACHQNNTSKTCRTLKKLNSSGVSKDCMYHVTYCHVESLGERIIGLLSGVSLHYIMIYLIILFSILII